MKRNQGLSWLHGCCVAMFLTSSAVHAALQSGGSSSAVLSYDFLMDECMANDYRDKTGINSIGPLRGIISYVESCLPSNGVSDEARMRISSKGSVSTLMSLLGTKDYSVELWLQPQINPPAQLSYLSIGVDAKESTSCSNNFMVR